MYVWLNKTVAQKQAMKESFENWLSEYEAKLLAWFEVLEPPWVSRLDYSLESTKDACELLVEKITLPAEVRNKENSDFLEGLAIYLGETYRKNMPLEASWSCPSIEIEYDNADWELFWRVSPDQKLLPSSGVSPSCFFYFVVKTKKVDKYYEYYSREIGRAEKVLIKDMELPKKMPGKGGYAYGTFIFIEGADFGLQKVAELTQAYLKQRDLPWTVEFFSKTHLLVGLPGDYYFHYYLDERSHVEVEAQEMSTTVFIPSELAEQHSRESIAGCKRKIEFYGDDDKNWDYGNEQVELLNLLADLPGLHIVQVNDNAIYEKP